MRALIILPVLALTACQVSEDKANNQSTITLSGEAAKNGTASALDGISNTVDSAATKVNDVSNNAGEVRSGLSNLGASASRFGQSVEGAANSVGNAVEGGVKDIDKPRVEVTTNTTKTETKK